VPAQLSLDSWLVKILIGAPAKVIGNQEAFEAIARAAAPPGLTFLHLRALTDRDVDTKEYTSLSATSARPACPSRASG
jgi:hypothetical protein